MRTILVLLMLFAASGKALAQEKKDSTGQYRYTVPNLRYFGSYFTDLSRVTVAPGKWKSKELMMFGAVGATSLVLMTYDMRIQTAFADNVTENTEWAAKYVFEPFGNYQYLVGTSTFLYTLGIITGNDKHKSAGLTVAKAYLVSGVVAQVLKRVGSRHRPYQFKGDPNPYAWEGFSFKYNSFPSGHTTAAFAMATVVASMYQETIVVPVLAYGMATMTGLSRIHDNQHWASDVFAGAALGWSIAKFIVKYDGENFRTKPYTDGKTTGISLQYTF